MPRRFSTPPTAEGGFALEPLEYRDSRDDKAFLATLRRADTRVWIWSHPDWSMALESGGINLLLPVNGPGAAELKTAQRDDYILALDCSGRPCLTALLQITEDSAYQYRDFIGAYLTLRRRLSVPVDTADISTERAPAGVEQPGRLTPLTAEQWTRLHELMVQADPAMRQYPKGTLPQASPPPEPRHLTVLRERRPTLRLEVYATTSTIRLVGANGSNDGEYSSPTAPSLIAVATTAQGPEDYGRRLFQSVIHGGRSVSGNQPANSYGYQKAVEEYGDFAFEVRVDPADRRLRALKWEYLTPPHGEPIAVNRRTPLCRRAGDVPVGSPAESIRVLVVMSSPTAVGKPGNKYLENLEPLDLVSQRDIVESTLGPLKAAGHLDYLVLGGAVSPPVTLATLGDALQNDFNVLHLFAHGLFLDSGEFAVAIEHEGRPMAGVRSILKYLLGARLRLALLDTCQSSLVVDEEAHGDPQSPQRNQKGLAHDLVVAGLPAVIGMQALFDVRSAGAFTERFYEPLARSGRVDVAVANARRELWTDGIGGPWAWGIPVLHLGTAARLFPGYG